MLKNIELNNFQSHKRSNLTLHPGVNIFTGNSDCGKSALMRGIIWALTNDLRGDFFVSNWAKNKKGTQTEDCSVVIDSVERQRGKDFNGYVVDSERFEALRNDVPDLVHKKFNIGDVNIQRQLDGPFMLSNTSGENARAINELVNLTDIDRASSWIISQQRDCISKIKILSADVDELSNKIKDENAISELLKELEHLDGLSSRISELEQLHDEGTALIAEYSNIKNYDTDILEEYVSALEHSEEKTKVMKVFFREMSQSVSEYEKHIGRIVDEESFPNIDRLNRKSMLINELSAEYSEGERDLSLFKNLTDTQSTLIAEIDSLSEELSNTVCPMCGRVGHIHCA